MSKTDKRNLPMIRPPGYQRVTLEAWWLHAHLSMGFGQAPLPQHYEDGLREVRRMTYYELISWARGKGLITS